MPKEIENKLLISSETIPLLRQKLSSMATLEDEPIKKSLLNLYWDTPTLQLQKMGYSLRLRKSGKSWTQTIKKASQKPTQKGQHAHQEWETSITKKGIDSNLFPISIRRLLQPLLTQLQPIFESHIKREIWLLAPTRNTLIELAIDQGYLLVHKKKIPVCEVELELKKGSFHALHQITNELAKEFHLVPGNKTKAERGYEAYVNGTW